MNGNLEQFFLIRKSSHNRGLLSSLACEIGKTMNWISKYYFTFLIYVSICFNFSDDKVGLEDIVKKYEEEIQKLR